MSTVKPVSIRADQWETVAEAATSIALDGDPQSDPVQDRLARLEAENERLRAELDEANQRVAKAEFKVKSAHSDAEFHEERYRQQRDNFSMLWKAVAQNAPQVWDEVKDKLIDMSPGERDKTMSWAMRYRELEQRADDLQDAVSRALRLLGVDPSDWSGGKAGIEAAVKSNLQIGSDKLKDREDWCDDDWNLEGTITERLFSLTKRIADVREALVDIQATARTSLDSGAWGTHEMWLEHMKQECEHLATMALRELDKSGAPR